jgi:hypothetical protein
MPSDREITETIRNIIHNSGTEAIHAGMMATAFVRVLSEYGGRQRSRMELRDLILVEAAQLGVRAIDAPH